MSPQPPRAGLRSYVPALLRALAVIGLVAILSGATPLSSPALESRLDLAASRATAAVGLSRDSVRQEQWQLSFLHASRAWRSSTGAGITVAVIDSGVDGNHPDLKGQVLPGLDLVEPEHSDGWTDAVGHGTTVAALIAGKSADGKGVSGLAPDAKILPIRVLDQNNVYHDSVVVSDAIIWAVDHGAKIVNLSLGSAETSPQIADAIDYAFARDVVVVACAGNVITDKEAKDKNLGPEQVTSTTWYPAREPGVIAVTALGPRGTIWHKSLTGPATVLAAPGSALPGARPGAYEWVEGTSFAAPLVSATAALVRAKWPAMSSANVVQRLIRSAHDLGIPGRDDLYGFGAVDPVDALTADIPAVVANPLDTAPHPPGKAGFGTSLKEYASATPTVVTTAIASVTAAHEGRTFGLAAGMAGFAVLIGSSLGLLRRLLPKDN